MQPFAKRTLSVPLSLASWLVTAFVFLLGALPSARAHEHPLGCSGSGLGINLFTDSTDAHIGDTIHYSVTVLNGLPDSPLTSCDATSIQAYVVTPDGKTNIISLVRTTLLNGQSDFYPNVASYVVRAQVSGPMAPCAPPPMIPVLFTKMTPTAWAVVFKE